MLHLAQSYRKNFSKVTPNLNTCVTALILLFIFTSANIILRFRAGKFLYRPLTGPLKDRVCAKRPFSILMYPDQRFNISMDMHILILQYIVCKSNADVDWSN